jgi:hypothetical protein
MIAVAFWAALTLIVIVLSIRNERKEKTGIIKAEDFTEQCKHYHYGPDQTRDCMDKFLIKK